jgi:cobyrinic acid a,c-diamide synthase
VEYTATPAHPWGQTDTPTKAHEFHYARLENLSGNPVFARTLTRGAGIDGQHDAIVINNLVAGFCHLRNTAENPWVDRFLGFVSSCRKT